MSIMFIDSFYYHIELLICINIFIINIIMIFRINLRYILSKHVLNKSFFIWFV